LVGCRYGPEHTFDLLARWLTALAAVVDRLAAQDLHGLSDAVRAERVLVLRRLVDRLEGHRLHELAAVARGAAAAEQRHQRRGLWLASTWTAWSRSRARWNPKPARPAGRPGPLTRPPPPPTRAAAPTPRRRLTELARRALEGRPPAPDRWVRPQLPGTVDLDSRQAAPLGGDPDTGPWTPGVPPAGL